ncbi:MAG: hypothetical protein WAW85_07715 [Gordonia sp. (in: high G+C Gram-positive bacteria)]|uniref:hypothetical protein n=1 Tax=Gordonia sp. (in: high G+C Gram-positive bacteria) TaxID=84139 RepID=UPI003BB7F3D2
MSKRIAYAAAAAATATVLAAGAAGEANARWTETPRIGVVGEEVWTAGKNNCHGSFHAGLQSDPAKPGMVRLTLRSAGFTKNNCKITVRFTYNNATPPFHHDRYLNVQGQRRPGALMAQKTYWIGSGLDLVAISTTHPASKGVSYYIAIA